MTNKGAAHFDSPHTRPDCVRDNRRIPLPHLGYPGGFAQTHAKRGYWISANAGWGLAEGRVIGRVRCEGKVYAEALMLSDMGALVLRWILPEDIRRAYITPPRRALEMLLGDWNDPAGLIARVEHGESGRMHPDKES